MPASNLTVETELPIAATPQAAFDAIVDPARMAGYFITHGSGRLDEGQPVVWSWSDHGGAELTITPQEIIPAQKVCFLWSATGAETSVVINIEAGGASRCVVKVSESQWPRDAAGIASCLQQTQGWMHMLCCLKAYLEFGINLRTGVDAPA